MGKKDVFKQVAAQDIETALLALERAIFVIGEDDQNAHRALVAAMKLVESVKAQ